MVTKVMNSFCNLPGSQALLTQGHAPQGQVLQREASEDSVSAFTSSITALTCSLDTDIKTADKNPDSGNVDDSTLKEAPEMETSVTSLNSTAQDASTLSNESEYTESESSPSAGLADHPKVQRPSSLPVPRSITPSQ